MNITTIKVAEHTVVLRAEGRSQSIVAQLLGSETDSEGNATFWLDRLVHKAGDELPKGWSAGGTITTILFKSVADEREVA